MWTCSSDIPDSDNNYLFSIPNAYIGWNSNQAQYFLASLSTMSLSTTCLYTLIGLFLSLHKKHFDIMLSPVFRLWPKYWISIKHLKPKYMCLISISDSLAIYQFSQDMNIIPLIDNNKRRKPIENKTCKFFNSDGIRVCSYSYTMKYDGYDHIRYWKK